MKTNHHNKNFKSFSPCCFLFTVFFFLSTSAFAFDFDGSLKKITITDSDGANIAPSAVITYTQDGDTVNFDASGSSDSDGTISEYRWDFGDGSFGTGGSISHQFADGDFRVTLSVVDNQGGVALSQIKFNNNLLDYNISLTFRSQDDDGVGIMFCFQDNNNYYRFSWDKERTYRRLIKKVNGIYTVLAEDNVPYVQGEYYKLEVSSNGTDVQVMVDDATIFLVSDSTFSDGMFALYAWANTDVSFDNIIARNLSTGGLNMSENFDLTSLSNWSVVDEGTNWTPSAWEVVSNELKNLSNIYGGTTSGDDVPKPGTYLLYNTN